MLGINPLAIRVLRTDEHRARRTNHRQAMVFYRSVESEHEDIIAQHLWIVRGEVASGKSFEFVGRDALIGPHRKVAAKARGRPGGMTNLTGDISIVVREGLWTGWFVGHIPPSGPIAPERFRIPRFWIVVA